MKINLIVTVLFVFALGCRKIVEPRPLSNGTNTFPLDRIDNICFAKDKGLLISGTADNKYTLIKTDANLNVEWMKNEFDWGKFVRGSGWGAYFYGIKIVKAFEREDGSYVCIGAISEGGDVVFSSALIIVLDKYGKQLKKYRFDNLLLWDALKTDNGYVLFGTQLIKLDNNFNRIWTKPIYNHDYFPSEITATADGGFAITGSDNYEQVYLEKIDANGNELFTKKYKHNDFPFEEGGFDITQLADAGFLIVGRTGEVTASSNNIINCQMIRTNSKGDTLWTKRFGYSVNSWIDHIVSNNQNELVLQASIGFPDDSVQNAALFEINSEGEILNSKITDRFLLLAYSPFNLYVKAESNSSGGIKLSVMKEDDLFN